MRCQSRHTKWRIAQFLSQSDTANGDVFEFTDNYPWALPTGFAVVLLFGLFLRRRALARTRNYGSRGKRADHARLDRARIQFLMTLGCVVLLFLIWALQT